MTQHAKVMKAAAMALGDLAAAVVGPTECRGEATIRGLAHDSRAVEPGDLFFCVPGAVHDGHNFASAALGRGAAALVVERALPLACPQLITACVRAAMGPISAAYFDHPTQAMQVVGVTGTNGKTTVCSLLGGLLNTSGTPAQAMGTLSGTLTTPEAIDLQRQMACWRSGGVAAVAMEVSSHALHQHRVDAISYDLAVFTNLSSDHLDYHGTLERYFAAKARLFTPELARQALVNVADPFGQRLAAHPAIPTTEFDPGATVVRASTRGLTMQWRTHEVSLGLLGRFNAVNALTAAEAALLLGMDEQHVVAGLESAAPVPGRCEPIPTQLPITVLVDYAHTPDALIQVLKSAREMLDDDGQLRVVFGCGGERDPSKRSEMGQVAAALCDQVVITSDNPRSENPETIIAEIMAGAESVADKTSMAGAESVADKTSMAGAESVASSTQHFLQSSASSTQHFLQSSASSTQHFLQSSAGSIEAVTDRRAAITECLRSAGVGDVVVIAGKGHETTQTIGAEMIGFDDRMVAREVLAALEAQR